MATRRSNGEKVFGVFNYIGMAILSLIALYPFYYIVISSFSDPQTGTRSFFWVKDFYWANYWIVFQTEGLARAYLISVLRVATGVPLMLVVTSAAAFAMSRTEFKDKSIVIGFFFVTMFFGGGLIPTYLVYKSLGLLNNFLIYIVPSMFNIWTMIVMRTSMKALPEGMVEAARIDGAGYTTIFLRIVLPLSKAMLAALGLFAAVAHWNDWFLGAFFVASKPALHPLQTFLQITVLGTASTLFVDANNAEMTAEILRTGGNPEDLLKMTPASLDNAYIVLATIPILMVYPFVQKHFVKGIMIGSLKG
jgi:putative aldouronate transport system permease protein